MSGRFPGRSLDLQYCLYVVHDGGDDDDDCDDLYGHDDGDDDDIFEDVLAEDVVVEEENLLKLLHHWSLQMIPFPQILIYLVADVILFGA